MAYEGKEIEVIELDTTLAQGSLEGCRRKFAESQQRVAIEKVVCELEDESLYLGDWRRGEIQIVGIERIITTRFWIIVIYEVLFPPRQGNKPSRGTYQNVRYNVGLDAGAGAFLITTKGEVVLVRSFRHAKRQWTLELPRGVRLPDETTEQCAIREAQEECGATLTDKSEVIKMSVIDPDTGLVAQEVPVFVITNVEVDPEKTSRDVSESVLGPVVMRLPMLYSMITQGQITDAWIQSALLQAQLRGLVDPPRVIPTYGCKEVMSEVHHWNGGAFLHSLSVRVLADGRILLSNTPEDYCSGPPSVHGEFAGNLTSVIRYLKRPSRRKDGVWRVKLAVVHGYSYGWVSVRSDELYGGSIASISFYVNEKSDALALVGIFEACLVQQATIRMLAARRF